LFEVLNVKIVTQATYSATEKLQTPFLPWIWNTETSADSQVCKLLRFYFESALPSKLAYK